jgi:hypothetical protein
MRSRPFALKTGFVFVLKLDSLFGGRNVSADLAAFKNVFITALTGTYFVLDDIVEVML